MEMNCDNNYRLDVIQRVSARRVSIMHIDETKKFDKRTIERNLKEGIISAQEWEKYLKALPDVSDNTDFVMLEEGQEVKTAEEHPSKSEESVEEETPSEKEG